MAKRARVYEHVRAKQNRPEIIFEISVNGDISTAGTRLRALTVAKKIAAITPGSSACTDLRQLNVCNNLAIIDFESGERHT